MKLNSLERGLPDIEDRFKHFYILVSIDWDICIWNRLKFLKALVPCVDTSQTCVDTSSLYSSVETHCLQVLTLPVLGVDTWSSSLKSLATIRKCQHFLNHVSTLVFPYLNLWLLTLGVNIFVTSVDTSRSRISSLATDFRCRHFYCKCQHFSPRIYFSIFLVIWAPIPSWSLKYLFHGCAWSSICSIHLNSWFSPIV